MKRRNPAGDQLRGSAGHAGRLARRELAQ